jgi:hypothetical protein
VSLSGTVAHGPITPCAAAQDRPAADLEEVPGEMTTTETEQQLRDKAESYARDARKFREAAELGQPIISAAEDAHWATVYQAIAEELRKCAGDDDDAGAFPVLDAPRPRGADSFRECDGRELARQIGAWNIRAISGGRITTRPTGITLPVSSGYRVTIDLAGNDTYTVRRVFTRAGRTWIKGERTGIYCDNVGEIAYQASCYRNIKF